MTSGFGLLENAQGRDAIAMSAMHCQILGKFCEAYPTPAGGATRRPLFPANSSPYKTHFELNSRAKMWSPRAMMGSHYHLGALNTVFLSPADNCETRDLGGPRERASSGHVGYLKRHHLARLPLEAPLKLSVSALFPPLTCLLASISLRIKDLSVF